MNALAFPFAQGVDDLVGILIVILFIVIPAIGQLVSKLREAKPPQPQDRAQAGGQRPIRRPARDVEDEIGEFLRRAARRHGGKPGEPGEPAEPPRPAAKPMMAEAVKGPEPAEAAGPPAAARAGADHFAGGRLSKQASQLGRQATEQEKQMAKHRQEVFDHDAGQLAAPPKRRKRASLSATKVSKTPTAAVGVAAMLASTESIRQAIVINEVLQRPEHRWR